MNQMQAGEDGDETALARFILELRSKGLTDPAMLNAFERVPRGDFVPGFPPLQHYSPAALPLPCGEEATDPFTLARHLLLLDIHPGHRVLEIGTGSGFLAAIMARLGGNVLTYERYRTLLENAEAAFRRNGITDVTPVLGDGLARLDRTDGFDRIIVNGTLDSMPQHLMDRLGPGGVALAHRRAGEGARLFVWKKDLSGYPLARDCGPSRLPPMREGLPKAL